MPTASSATGSRPLSNRAAPRIASGARNSSSEAIREPAAEALAERIKELNCLYGISNLFETEGVSLPWIMQRAVDLIPAAWQYPENACARIAIDGQVFTTANFRPTAWKQTTAIVVNGQKAGNVCVCYLTPPPGAGDPFFLEEEQRLLAAIGERLGKVLWLKRAEEALRESEERYRVLTEQVTEGVALVQDDHFRYVNPAFCRIFALASPAALAGRPIRPPGIDDDPIARCYGGLQGENAGRPVTDVQRLPCAGAACWIQVSHNPISYRGRPALLSTFRDVTDLKEQQMAAERRADSLGRENRVLRSSLRERYRLGDIIGRCDSMQTVYEMILKAAATDASVAIYGESGTGKELVARAIHDHGHRKGQRFLAVNCGAIQEPLFEREFFGHRKGAFSGAHADAPGYLDLAAGGTLFLDEVGELTLSMQVKLLRALEGGGYTPVGDTEPRVKDFRIISAANIPLCEKVAAGAMREDFFYRVQVIQIRLPPLRQRRQDIPLLVDHFLRQMAPCFGAVRVPGRIMDLLMDHDWPGNVRELRNVLQRYATLGHLEFFGADRPPAEAPAGDTSLNLPQAVGRLEQALISRALAHTGGHRTRAAGLLGISRRALFRKLAAAPVPLAPESGENAQTASIVFLFVWNNLTVFPASGTPFALQWQRGSKRPVIIRSQRRPRGILWRMGS
ncbi:MAG TPA: sigma-54-dependent Fis family transcriptional regulator [Desulfobacteraceae bacterium]|nr:sigma-54-dependent Fis family transcriptional regulator [Desulfobacteraceae bacterium]